MQAEGTTSAEPQPRPSTETPAVTAPMTADVPAPAGRIASVDALRGLVILLMIFVNDVAGVRGLPGWLKHASARDDAMTLPDIVFPAFLFIAGVSIPLALERARALGQATRELVGKILLRSFALLVMGVVMVNIETHNPWTRGAWGVLAYLALFLTFAVAPEKPGRLRAALRIGRWIGAAALIALALAYTNADGKRLVCGPLFDAGDTVWLRHEWWGILGLIAWAYLAASLLYLAIGRRREWLLAATVLLMLLYVAARADLPARLASREWLAWAAPAISGFGAVIGWIDSHVSIGEALGSLASVTMAGCVLGAMLTPGSDVRTPRERLRWTAGFALLLLLGAVLLDAPYGLNKIRATPAWCWLSAALTAAAWALLYWLVDVRGVRRWTRWVQPAGANPLLAYVLHPFFLYAAHLTTIPLFFYKRASVPTALGVLGSIAMAFLIVQLTGWIARAGYRLKV